jgi:hypothetical protein
MRIPIAVKVSWLLLVAGVTFFVTSAIAVAKRQAPVQGPQAPAKGLSQTLTRVEPNNQGKFAARGPVVSRTPIASGGMRKLQITAVEDAIKIKAAAYLQDTRQGMRFVWAIRIGS